MDRKPILELKKVSKSFPGVKALKDIDFSLYPGEVHVLAGENGAGKSTLMKCILGVHSPDSGRIIYKGQEKQFRDTRSAMREGIAAVYQELTTIPYLDAVQNIFFEKEPRYGTSNIIRRRKLYEDGKKILRELHCENIPLHTPLAHLSIANQQMVEIAKALTLKPELLIFDEPTTSLTTEEVTFLFDRIRDLKSQGIAIVFISHRMKEMLEIGDRITILRDGQKICSQPMSGLSEEDIVEKMIGRDLQAVNIHEKSQMEEQENILEVCNISDYEGKVRECSLHVQKGEIVGISGLVGAGRSELSRLIYGIDDIKTGYIHYKGKSYSSLSPHRLVRDGMGFLPEDRKNQGLALKAPIHWNTLSASLWKHFSNGFLWEKKSRTIADRYIDELKVATTDSDKIVGALSGGNQQKVVLSKWFAADTDFFILDEPTRGIDVGAKQEIYELLEQMSQDGKSILVISSESEELMRICHRIYGMREGEIVGEIRRNDFSYEAIGDMILTGRRWNHEPALEESHAVENDASIWEESHTVENDTSISEESPSIENDASHIRKKREGYQKSGIGNNKTVAKRAKRNVLQSLPPAFYFCILLILIFALNTKNYFSFSNISNIMIQLSALLVMACGQALIVLLQGTDLSLGTLASMIGVLWMFLLNMKIPMIWAILLCILCGAICGAINGGIVAKGKIPVFIVTLGTQNIFKSVALLLCGSQTLYYSSKLFRVVTKGTIFYIPIIVCISFLCFLLTVFLVNRTTFGMRIRGLGGNVEGTRYSGVNVEWTQMKVFIYAGMMAAISGLLLACRIESGNPNAGNGMEFNSIAAVLLGGVSMREGKGRIEGVFFGILLIQLLKSGLNQVGMNSIYQNATIGIVVLLAIIVDAWLKFRGNRERSVD